jgi:hypothetical protein
MQLKFGPYAFPANQVTIATRIEVLESNGGSIYAHRHAWDVEGYLGTTQPLAVDAQKDLQGQMHALKVALLAERRDLILYRDDGSPSATQLVSAGSITGVKISRGPDFARTQGPEYATERQFSFSAYAEYPVTSNQSLILEYQETVDVSGGGPGIIHKPNLYGPPQKQITFAQLPYAATQSGFAVGYYRYPTVPAPLFPAALKQAPRIGRVSPRRRRAVTPWQFEGYRVTWSYEFESASPLVGEPRVWILSS